MLRRVSRAACHARYVSFCLLSLTPGPTLIGTEAALGVGPSHDALLFVIASPVGPYYPKGFKPVQLYATTEFVRAAPGGTGAYKLGAK